MAFIGNDLGNILNSHDVKTILDLCELVWLGSAQTVTGFTGTMADATTLKTVRKSTVNAVVVPRRWRD